MNFKDFLCHISLSSQKKSVTLHPNLHPVMKRISIAFFIIVLLASCSKEAKRTADISGMDTDFHIQRFDSAFWFLDTVNLQQSMSLLSAHYPEMGKIYMEYVMRMGATGSDTAATEYRNFRKYPAVVKVYESTLAEYSDLSDIEGQLKPALLRLQVFMPHFVIPDFYTHVSFFNQNIIVGNGFISLSLDNYMGPDYCYYDSVAIHQYLRPNMRREKIASDYLTALLASSLPLDPSSNLLTDMIFHGKILYTVSCLLPETPENIILGYTEEQLKWAEQNEKGMWKQIVEDHTIYTTNVIDKAKFTRDAPFTQPFGQDSPGRLGAYLGYKIVCSYMRHNQKVTIAQLLQNQEAQDILNHSNY